MVSFAIQPNPVKTRSGGDIESLGFGTPGKTDIGGDFCLDIRQLFPFRTVDVDTRPILGPHSNVKVSVLINDKPIGTIIRSVINKRLSKSRRSVSGKIVRHQRHIPFAQGCDNLVCLRSCTFFQPLDGRRPIVIADDV